MHYDDDVPTLDEQLAGGSCPYCGQVLPDGLTVRSEPMFEPDSPGRFFFCAYCGLPLLGGEPEAALQEEHN